MNLKDESDRMSPRDESYGASPKVSIELSPKEESDELRREAFLTPQDSAANEPKREERGNGAQDMGDEKICKS